jgi:hypothetical protein
MNETLGIFQNRRLHRDILHDPRPSRLHLRHRRIRPSPPETKATETKKGGNEDTQKEPGARMQGFFSFSF